MSRSRRISAAVGFPATVQSGCTVSFNVSYNQNIGFRQWSGEPRKEVLDDVLISTGIMFSENDGNDDGERPGVEHGLLNACGSQTS